jgi:hypothetical protein
MTALDADTRASLDRFVLPFEESFDWTDVLERAGIRTRPRFGGRRTVALAGLVATALFVAFLLPWNGRDRGIVDRALAAVGPGPVIHVVTRQVLQGTTELDLSTGREAPIVQETETWIDDESGVVHEIVRVNGDVRSDSLHRVAEPAIADAHSTAAFAVDYRRSLERGEAKQVGEGTVAGRPVYFLKLRPTQSTEPLADATGESSQPDEISAIVAVDRETFRAVRLQALLNGRPWGPSIDVLQFETTSRAGADLTPVRTTAVTGISAGSSPISIDQVGNVLSVPALWAGSSVAARPLNEIYRQALVIGAVANGRVANPTHGTALELLYGADQPGAPDGITIVEAASARPDANWVSETPGPKPGLAELRAETVFGSNAAGTAQDVKLGTKWIVVLERSGLLVRVEAWSREDVLAAARALRPL